MEQERIIILTKVACYRIKYDFIDTKFIRFDRIELSAIIKIQVLSFYSLLYSFFYSFFIHFV